MASDTHSTEMTCSGELYHLTFNLKSFTSVITKCSSYDAKSANNNV